MIKCNVNNASPRCSRKLNKNSHPHMCLRNGGTWVNFFQDSGLRLLSNCQVQDCQSPTASRTLEPMRCLSLPGQPMGTILIQPEAPLGGGVFENDTSHESSEKSQVGSSGKKQLSVFSFGGTSCQ